MVTPDLAEIVVFKLFSAPLSFFLFEIGSLKMSFAPPGVIPNYVDPPDHRTQTIILHTICLALVTSALSMRLYTRFCVTRSGGIDDCMYSPAEIIQSCVDQGRLYYLLLGMTIILQKSGYVIHFPPWFIRPLLLLGRECS